MSTPINIVHITDSDIVNGVKYHVSLTQRNKIDALSGVTDTYTFVTSADFDNQKLKFRTLTIADGVVTDVSSETAWI